MTRAPYLRTPQSSPSVGHTQSLVMTSAALVRSRDELMRGVELLDAVIEAQAEVAEAGSWSGGNGSITAGRQTIDTSDNTGDVASSPAHAFMRREAGFIADQEPQLRKAMRPVIDLIDGWERGLRRAIPLALDSSERERLQIADEADRDYRRRKHSRTG